MKAPKSLRGRLAAWYSAVLTATLLAFAGAVYFFVDTDEDEPPRMTVDGREPEHVGRELIAVLAIALPGALALAVAGGLWITRRMLRPLDEVARVARDLTGGERLDRRVELPAEASSEIQELASVFNGMLDHIDRSVSGMRRFTADASHELRTPLSVLRGELEVTLRHPRSAEQLRESLETALGETERLSELVESLLTLARTDGDELPIRRELVDLVEAVRHVLSPFEAVATHRKLALTWRAGGPIEIETDTRWLGHAVANLVDNACKFTPPGGGVDIEITRVDDQARIIVADTGPGISADERDRVFERFYRSKRTQGEVEGFGLGLALSRDIVRALGGTLDVGANGSAGARFMIELPARVPAQIPKIR
jgi:signal transduction histidine kinase